jgi:hypothetical protein
MKKMMTLMIAISFLSTSCNKSGGSSSGGSTQATKLQTSQPGGATSPNNSSSTGSTTSAPTVTSLPNEALSFQTNVELLNFDNSQADKYSMAVSMVKKVVGTEKFRTAILNHSWNGTKQFANNAGKSNEEIYKSVLDAAESLHPVKNNSMDLGVKLYYQNNTVIGFTNGSISYINVNTKYFNQFAINDVAGNLFHEWLHKLGYVHDYSSTTQRPHSVPYAIGYIVRDIGKSFL